MTEVEKEAEQWLDESPVLIQKELGKRLGVTSHIVGKLLTEAGLRSDGRPTKRAFDGKFVVIEQSGDWPQYRWNERRVVPILRDRMNLQSGMSFQNSQIN